jgi:hypothetical protein
MALRSIACYDSYNWNYMFSSYREVDSNWNIMVVYDAVAF